MDVLPFEQKSFNPWMVTWGYFIPPDCYTCCFYGKSLKFLQSLWWLFLILIMLQNCLEIILLAVWLFAIWRRETIGHQQEVTTYCAAYTLCFFFKTNSRSTHKIAPPVILYYLLHNWSSFHTEASAIAYTVRLQVQPTTVQLSSNTHQHSWQHQHVLQKQAHCGLLSALLGLYRY